ncbi:MAG: EpsG family protein [Eubacteriales bacterium]|nr:EpsG family protein [Eubacteriales bacterium]
MFSQYILILIWIGVMSVIAGSGIFSKVEMIGGQKEYRLSWWFAFVMFLPVILMAGNRTIYIGDTNAYMKGFLNTPDVLSLELLAGKDWGVSVFSIIIKKIIGDNASVFLMIIAVIQGILVVDFFRKYSYNYAISIFLFVVSSDFISWMYNGIRQFLAVTIILAGTSLMLSRKYIALLFVILLASTFHQSALLMIPFVLIAQGKAWNKRTIFFIILVILAVLFVERFTDFLDDSLANTQYANVVSDYTSWEDDGTNPFRVLVYSIPALLSFLGKGRIRESENELVNFCTNMSIISMGLYLVSMVTSGIFIGRLPIYVSLYGYILLPWEIENLFTRESKRMVYIGMVCAYLMFYYYQMHLTYGLF